VETDDEGFERDVIERSRETPVVVDFWAEWCGPCRMLGPVLEQLAEEYAGKFTLVKADTERTPGAAAAFQVSSIPAVYGIVHGEPVDSFLGAIPPEQIRLWLDRLIRHAALADTARLEQSDLPAAEASYRQLLAAAPNDSEASIGLARVLLAQDRTEDCRELLESLAERGFLEPEAEKLKAKLEFRRLRSEDLTACRAAAESNPDDLSLRLRLAEVLAANQQFQQAFEIILDLLAKDRHGVGELGRQKMVEMFRLLPEDSPLLTEYRRKLSLLLF
jgi:putative thioredoxin